MPEEELLYGGAEVNLVDREHLGIWTHSTAAKQHFRHSWKIVKENLQFYSIFRIIYMLHWQQHMKRTLNRIHIVVSSVLLFVKKVSLHGWRDGSAVLDICCLSWGPKLIPSIHGSHLITTAAAGNPVHWSQAHTYIQTYTYIWLKLTSVFPVIIFLLSSTVVSFTHSLILWHFAHAHLSLKNTKWKFLEIM